MDLLEDDDGDMDDKGKWKNKTNIFPAIASVFVLAGWPAYRHQHHDNQTKASPWTAATRRTITVWKQLQMLQPEWINIWYAKYIKNAQK